MLDTFKYLDISENQIKAKYKSIVNIDLSDYDTDTLHETTEYYVIPGILDIYMPDLENTCHIFLNYNVKLYKPDEVEESGKNLILTYKPGDLIIFQDFVDNNVNMKLIINLLEGRTKYIKDPKILLLSLYQQLSGIDLIHLELIISNMFRCVNDLSKRCRYTGNYNNSVILGQWEQPFNDSWLSAISFERIDKAIHTGLVKHSDIEKNPMELIIDEQYEQL